MSLVEDMRKHMVANAGEGSRDLAASFLASHTKVELAPLVAEEFEHLARSDVRHSESIVAVLGRAKAGRSIRLKDTRALLADLAPILEARYAVGDGSPRAGRDMTVEDWTARRSMLHGQIAGLQRAAMVCDRAVELIRAYGVSTLGEIESVAEVAA